VIATDPNHPLHPANIDREWRRLLDNPVGLQRPLVVFSGWRAPWWAAWNTAERLRRLTGGARDMVLPVPFTFHNSVDAMVRTAIDRVAEAWPTDGRTTVEVDVVGVSMGGLIARAAAAPAAARHHGRRLAIANLFTVSTPHRGAKLARYIAPDTPAREMRTGSAWLARLDEALPCCEYNLVCYTLLNDLWVGARNTAPEGHCPIWFPGRLFGNHILVTLDRRIFIDIARRLRGEPPAACPNGPPPHD
jgi:pimeloyl-ACP methyl ester carboxylesterase